MEYRNLGNSGLQVSVVGIGTNQIGGRVDQDQTVDIINKAIEVGITFIDTSDSYGRGKSEEFLGQALKPHRRNVVIGTKVNSAMGEGPYWSGNSRRYVVDAVDACLRRLDTDYIDLLQIHRPDPKTPIEETLRTLDDLVKAGKVRYIGCSNYSGWQLVEAEWAARMEHTAHYISSQSEWSLLERRVERDVVPVCDKYSIGLIPFYPLASGFLTGKYRPDEAPPEGSRLSRGGMMAERTLSQPNFEKLIKLETYAQERGHTMVELAMSWLSSQPSVASVIAGVTRPEQVEENARACEWHMRPEELKEIDELMSAGQ